jgi:hypothetical protein
MIWALVFLATMLPFVVGMALGFWYAISHVQGMTSRLPTYRKRWVQACELIDHLQGEVFEAKEALDDKQAEMVLKLTRARAERPPVGSYVNPHYVDRPVEVPVEVPKEVQGGPIWLGAGTGGIGPTQGMIDADVDRRMIEKAHRA